MPKQKLTLKNELENLKLADGYLVAITRRKGDRLYHSFFTFNFTRGDIPISLKQWEKLLKKEAEGG